MSAKQILLAHLREHHKNVKTTGTFVVLRRDHARDHHRYGGALAHYHEGVNSGPSQRPPGWSTGEGVVMKRSAR